MDEKQFQSLLAELQKNRRETRALKLVAISGLCLLILAGVVFRSTRDETLLMLVIVLCAGLLFFLARFVCVILLSPHYRRGVAEIFPDKSPLKRQ